VAALRLFSSKIALLQLMYDQATALEDGNK